MEAKRRRALIVMARWPESGQAKTRLSPPLTLRQAAGLAGCFLQDTLALARGAKAARILAYTPPEARDYFARAAPDFELIEQVGAGLGERLAQVLEAQLAAGCLSVVAMDSDSPTLPPGYLEDAFRKLEAGAEAVFGPCEDGGYYLVGLTRPASRLLREVQMSTHHVLRDSLVIAGEDGLRVSLLPPWYDVDDAVSLDRLRAELRAANDLRAPATGAFLRWLDRESLSRGAAHK